MPSRNRYFSKDITHHLKSSSLAFYFLVPAFVFHLYGRRDPCYAQFNGKAMIELSVAVYPELVEGSQSFHPQSL